MSSLQPSLKRGHDKQVRYVLYVRKSTESDERQIKSLEDQLAECKEYANRKGLIIQDIIQEKGSARKSNNRPKFNQMIKDLEAGKYNGILAWHPDRLARNMLESGIIIDLVDTGTIQDLKFPTLDFVNNSSGKMLLGMMFVMSKQYSEHLSESVQRGMDTNLQQGKSAGQHKWGYIRNKKTGLYEKDPETYDTIRQAWQMRIDGHSNKDILTFLLNRDIHYATNDGKKILPKSNSLTRIFRDPFYYGVLCQAGQDVDLREVVTNFEPMVSEKDWNRVQSIGYITTKHRRSDTKKVLFLPLNHGFVKCGVCGRPMTAERSKGKAGNYYMYYRCHNEECHKKQRSIRAHIVFDTLYGELDKLHFDEQTYNLYRDEMRNYSSQTAENLRRNKKSIEGMLSQERSKLERLFDNYTNTDRENIKKRLEDRINKTEEDISNLEEELREIKHRLTLVSKSQLSKEDFLNTLDSLADKMRAGDAVEKDALARKLILNIVIDDKNTPSFIWKEPFATLLNSSEFTHGWG